ncbi:DMT family transporter [Hyphobacterium sp. CCMP332]|nr:DMT family transporter [Hyphobacterium sp. CCMP332]
MLIILALIWGSSFILIKKGLIALNPLQIASLRVVSAGLVLLPWSVPNILKIPKERFRFIFLVGVIGNLIPAFLFAYSQQFIKSSLAGMLNGLTPLFTMLIGAMLFSDTISKGKFWGMLIGLIGSSALLFVGSEGQLGQFNTYALLVILATMCYGTGINIIKAKLQGVKSTFTSSTALLFTVPFGLSYLLFDGFFIDVFTDKDVLISSFYILLLGIFGTGFAVMLFYKLVEISNPLMASSVTYLIPIIAVMWGVFDGEKLFLMHFISLAIIIFGVYLINRSKG